MAWVQGPTPAAASAASVAKAFTSSTPAGNLVVAVISQNNGANPPRAITNVRDDIDTGVDYTLAVSKVDGGGGTRIDIYYKKATGAGTRTVTCSFTGGSADCRIAINEYDTHTVLSATNTNQGTTSPATPGAASPSGTALYIVGLTHTSDGAMTPDGAWSERQEAETLTSPTAAPIQVHDKITTGSQNPSTTMAATIGTWVSAIATFVQPSAALTGTALSSIVEGDIVAGGKTIIATLTNDTFVSNLATLVFVGNQSGKFAGTTSAQTINFSLANGIAAAPAAGDFVVISYAIGTAARTPTVVIENTSAVAYTTIGAQVNADDNFDTRLLAAYRFMPSPTETQFRLTATATAGTGDVADAGAYTVHVFRNVDTGTPMDTTAQTASGTNGHAADPPTITPVTSGAWVYAVGASAAGTSAVHTSSDLTGFLSQAQADTNDVAIGAGYSTSVTDPAAFGGGGAGTTTDSWCALTAALRPATTGTFDAARAAFINGFDSAQAEGTGWDAEVKAKAAVTEVVRTSATVVTWTIAAQAGYDITAQETITGTIPASILVGAAAIVATPTFTVDFTAGGGTIHLHRIIGGGGNRVIGGI